jgi:hypothetical protein
MTMAAIFWPMAGALCALLPALALAAPGDDVGMVTRLEGGARYQSIGAAALPLRAFMKIREGDRIEVDALGRVQIVYFEGGRQERWDGPASFTAGTIASTPGSGGVPAVRVLPAAVLRRIAVAPDVMNHIRNRTGMHTVRSVARSAAEDRAIRALRADVATVREGAPAGDLTADLLWISGLFQLRAYDEAGDALAALRAAYPNDAAVAELADNYKEMLRRQRAGSR